MTRRLKTGERGYGWRWQQQRARVKSQMERDGGALCWRCRRWINPGEPFDLGHDDTDRSIVRGPEHRKCNRSTIVHRGHPQQQEPQPQALRFFD